MGRLDGKVAIVTGASRGIGKGIATAFAAEGAIVAVVARTEAQWDPRMPGTIHDTVAEIEGAGGRALAVPADLADPEQVDRIVEVARAELGPVDILVNNAALTIPGRPPAGGASATPPPASPKAASPTAITGTRSSFVGFPLKGFRLHFEIGLFATYRLMQLVLPDMLERGGGAILNISSAAAYMPGEGPYENPGTAGPIAYGGNKAAMHHLTQAVAVEVQGHGVSVNALMPSEPVITPGTLVSSRGEDDWASPEDFAEATIRVALADPAVTTGQILFSEDVLHPELGKRGWLRGKL